MEKLPKINYERVLFEESNYDDGERVWSAETLIKHVEKVGLEPFKCPLAALDLSGMPINMETLDCVAYHFKRVMDCSLDYPIILSPLGCVIDGNHRVLKALVKGKKWIMAYRLQTMPEPDRIYGKEGEDGE